MARSGDSCNDPNCKGRLYVYISKQHSELGQVQYLRCDTCHSRPSHNQVILHESQVRRRKPRN